MIAVNTYNLAHSTSRSFCEVRSCFCHGLRKSFFWGGGVGFNVDNNFAYRVQNRTKSVTDSTQNSGRAANCSGTFSGKGSEMLHTKKHPDLELFNLK